MPTFESGFRKSHSDPALLFSPMAAVFATAFQGMDRQESQQRGMQTAIHLLKSQTIGFDGTPAATASPTEDHNQDLENLKQRVGRVEQDLNLVSLVKRAEVTDGKLNQMSDTVADIGGNLKKLFDNQVELVIKLKNVERAVNAICKTVALLVGLIMAIVVGLFAALVIYR
ncbi:hypothetical protein IE81DRAFT_348832 [Ceraceosorus guamensis]|uniref:Uncharacterized protein n=1 Tax=Ceraceosorus guamensis TaxID=1522189 RepID=A0A316VTH0_9BASI|nr:hypothetical protein IE81DRAFT_348832 [Ceraceosorus guamensis]PWN40886.1 hypothetical protein IE81DRAFT_348832 [Ceraceosorus guamensis]